MANASSYDQRTGWQRMASRAVRAFHAYGLWLTGLTWWRFGLLSVLLLILACVLQEVPPFSWRFTETVEHPAVRNPAPKPPQPPKPPSEVKPKATVSLPGVKIERGSGTKTDGVDITINEQGIRILSREAASTAASAVADAASAASAVLADEPPQVHITAGDKDVRITLPPGADLDELRAAIEEARAELTDALTAEREAEQAMTQAQERYTEMTTHVVRYGDALPQLAFLWIVMSAILKVTYKGRVQAEVKAAQATETAEAEALRRQVLEARVAAMQAQVEPHFLFNTLASIDHLIETDPPRASQMQKNLIALLRASMPTMRDTNEGGARDLARELAVVRPYVEILKVRMEERLDVHIDVPEGLNSAEFPAMMIQTLVENAIRHGLEPKAEGGSLTVRAEIVHGKLCVTVADTGVGFGQAATSGTGVGLANIRERLQLLYGSQASLTVLANQPSGTVVTVTVPYRTVGTMA